MNASSKSRFAAAGILAMILSAFAQVQAAEIPGKVRKSTNKYATVVSDSDLVPVTGRQGQNLFQAARKRHRGLCGDGSRLRNYRAQYHGADRSGDRVGCQGSTC